MKNRLLITSLAALLSININAQQLNSPSSLEQRTNLVSTESYSSYGYDEMRHELADSLMTAKRKSLDLTKQYKSSSESETAKLQYEIILATRSLHSMVYPDILYPRIKTETFKVDQKILEDYLNIMSEAEKALGNHPFHHVIIGRQKSVIKAATKNTNTFTIPLEFRKYINAKIPDWQDPHLNYTTINDLQRGKGYNFIPPEFRKQH
ncbi:MAG: hypothetical protein AABX11_06930 [Nanoarchaeota archaeon]